MNRNTDQSTETEEIAIVGGKENIVQTAYKKFTYVSNLVIDRWTHMGAKFDP